METPPSPAMEPHAQPSTLVLPSLEGRPWLAHYESQVPSAIQVPELTLHGFFERTVAEYGANTATIFFGERLTYSQLNDHATRFAAGLQSVGVKAGDRVAIILPNCPHFMVALFGILKAGAVAVPLNPTYVGRELWQIFSDAQVETVIALPAIVPTLQQMMPEISLKRVVVAAMQDYLSPLMSLMLTVKERRDGSYAPVQGEGIYSFGELVRNNSPEYAPSTALPDDVAMLLYTGGTTGTPKGAMLSHRNLVADASQMSAWVWDARPDRNDVFLGVIPFFHSYGMTVVMNLAIAVAGSIVLLPRFVMKDVLRAIARFRPTVFPAVPTIYNAIARHPMSARYDLRSIRVCISGASPLPMEIAQAFESVTGARLVEGYGLTETSPVTHCNPIHGERRAGSMGLPIPNTDARIVDPETRLPVPVGAVGELAVCGPQVMLGYYAQPEETAAILQDGWIYTGDMARMDEDGYFYIVDRKKDLILVGGYNVYPREVEEVLYENEKVLEVVVAGVPDPLRGEVVKAYVVLKSDMEASERELIKFCTGRLAPYKVPSKVEFRETLPKSNVGKYLRRELIDEAARVQ